MMIIRTEQQLGNMLEEWRLARLSIGFVPTMGALHPGHLSLITKSVQENDRTIISIFVNPTQFNEQSDFQAYPREEQKDLDMLADSGADLVFLPDTHVMYGENPIMLDLDLEGLDMPMEGKFRPGHFRGVVTVVDKFFRMIGPDKAYFGQKDFQQLTIIRLLAKKRHPQTTIVSCPIIREQSGLAMSSRNQLLNKEELLEASNISRILNQIKDKWRKMPVQDLLEEAVKSFNRIGMHPEYLEIVDAENLQHLTDYTGNQAVVCTAVRVGKVRLIDNIELPA